MEGLSACAEITIKIILTQHLPRMESLVARCVHATSTMNSSHRSAAMLRVWRGFPILIATTGFIICH